MILEFKKCSFFLNYKRFFFLSSCIFLAFIIIVLRLIYLQFIYSNKLIQEGNMRSLRVKSIPVFRGTITDRMGKLLAISMPAYAIWIDPQEILRKGGIFFDIQDWTKLSKILSISLDQLSYTLNKSAKIRFLYLARQLHPSVANCIRQIKLPGVYLCRESKRYYPSSQAFAHLIGVTDIDSQGIEGIEKSFNAWLSGKSEVRLVRQDRYGRIIDNIFLTRGEVACNITLSIDERLQLLAYHEIDKAVTLNKAESGSAILIDVNTGEVLAMVNSPSYNPNKLSSVNKFSMRNRAITDVFEPGSTVKPIVIMTALRYGIIKKDTVINTNPYFLNGYQIKDVKYHSRLSIQEILQKSSNVGVSKLALAMPISLLVDSYSRFGMGKSTQIGLIGESSGIYPNDSKKFWSDIDRAAFSYGYGLMITPLQLAKVYATIGSLGISRPLSIIKVNSPFLGEEIFSKSLVRTVLDMMEIIVSPVCDFDYGKSSICGYRFAVKTGTVKKIGLNKKYINRYVAYTAGVAPVKNPRVALVVVINDPKKGKYYGSMVSTPIFTKIMHNALKIMNIEPDYFS